MYPGLKRASDELMSTVVDQLGKTGEKQRLFMVRPYRAQKWSHSRSVIIKVECHAGGTNRRAVVTNRPGARIVPQGAYDDYIQRGESENRNKELKIDLGGGRLSDHRFMANLFRLCLYTLALNLLIRSLVSRARQHCEVNSRDSKRMNRGGVDRFRTGNASPSPMAANCFTLNQRPGDYGSSKSPPK